MSVKIGNVRKGYQTEYPALRSVSKQCHISYTIYRLPGHSYVGKYLRLSCLFLNTCMLPAFKEFAINISMSRWFSWSSHLHVTCISEATFAQTPVPTVTHIFSVVTVLPLSSNIQSFSINKQKPACSSLPGVQATFLSLLI